MMSRKVIFFWLNTFFLLKILETFLIIQNVGMNCFAVESSSSRLEFTYKHILYSRGTQVELTSSKNFKYNQKKIAVPRKFFVLAINHPLLYVVKLQVGLPGGIDFRKKDKFLANFFFFIYVIFLTCFAVSRRFYSCQFCGYKV